MYSETISGKHGLKKFFRNADASAGACGAALIGGLLIANIGYAICVSMGLDEIYKNSDVVLNRSMFWIGLIINIFFNLVAFAGLSCLISKINPKKRHGGVGLKFLAVVCCVVLWIIYILVKTILAGHGWRSIWDWAFFYELCRGVWRWVVGVKNKAEQVDSGCRPETALSKVRSEPESERQNAKVVQTVDSIDVQACRREECVAITNDYVSTEQEDADTKAGYDQIRENLYGSSCLDNSTTARTDGADKETAKQMDQSLGCLAWGVIFVAITMGIMIYSTDPFSDSSAQHDKNEILEECKREDARLNNYANDASAIEQLQEDQKKMSLEELSKTVLWSENVFEEPIEMRKRKQTTDFVEVAEAMNLDKFWGVQLGSVIEEAGGELQYHAVEECNNRYWFVPRCWPGDIQSFYVSVTPITHRVWRVGCATECETVDESLKEVERYKRRFACFKARGEEHDEVDGTWFIYPSNTNRTVCIYVAKLAHNYTVVAEAYDEELFDVFRDEGRQESDGLNGMFGINFGEQVDQLRFTQVALSKYMFSPKKRFFDFEHYCVGVSTRSLTIHTITAFQQYDSAEDAIASAAHVLNILRIKFPNISFIEGSGDDNCKVWKAVFIKGMEFPRRLTLSIHGDNFLTLQGTDRGNPAIIRSCESFQDEVQKLKQDAEAL